MKNIHVLPTDKPSRLWKNNLLQGKLRLSEESLWFNTAQHIHITNDEEIKEGDYYITILDNKVFKADSDTIRIMNDASKFHNLTYKNTHFKIILTTDQDLIKDGLQAIDDEFLEWFVKNPSCEEVEIDFKYKNCIPDLDDNGNKILRIKIPSKSENLSQIIPKEEAKQERSYSEEEVLAIVDDYNDWLFNNNYPNVTFKEWFEKFKTNKIMEAKEKAEELLDKFMNSDNMIFLIEGAKECALIAVDEILNEFPNGFNGNFEMKRKLYWEEVKQEIKQYKNGKK